MSDRTIFVDLNRQVGLAELPALGTRVLSWWWGELSGMLPAAVARLVPKSVPPSMLFVEGDAWRVVSATGTAQSLDAKATDQELTAQLLQAGPGLSKLSVVLPNERVLRRRVTLPVIADARLRSAVELQIDRLSPFQSDAVRFDARASSRDNVEGAMVADVVIIPRAPVDALEQRLSALGLKPQTIDVAGPDGEPSGFNLSTRGAPGDGRRASLITLAFAAVAVLAWYLAFYAWGAARERELAGWRATVEQLRPVAARSAALRRELEGLIEPQKIAQGHKPGHALNPLLELTKLLPADVRLSEFRLSGDTIDLTGLGADPPSLIGKLEASPLFKDVKFRSPVTRRPDLSKDRFEISMKLAAGAS